MVRHDDNPKPAVTPRQLALIGVLAVILAGVLYVQFGGQGEPDQPEAPTPSRAGPRGLAPVAATRDAQAKPSAGQPKPAGEPTPPRPAWPKLSADEAAAYDPFGLPEAFARTAAAVRKKEASLGKRQARSQRKAEQDRTLAALRSTGVAAVFRGPAESVAIVGRNLVRVGDELNGFRVVSIDPDGVLLAPSNPQDGQEDQP